MHWRSIAISGLASLFWGVLTNMAGVSLVDSGVSGWAVVFLGSFTVGFTTASILDAIDG
jgi:hypothetical protein